MNFALFLVVNAVLFLPPAAIFPWLRVPLFQHYITLTGPDDLPLFEIHGESVRSLDGAHEEQIRRFRFTGMLQDPNEVAVFLSVLVFLTAYQWQSRRYGVARHLWLVPLGVF